MFPFVLGLCTEPRPAFIRCQLVSALVKGHTLLSEIVSNTLNTSIVWAFNKDKKTIWPLFYHVVMGGV